jgi:hypothetical protein
MTGTPLVPVFAFGENDLYYQLPNSQGSILRWLQEKALIYCKFALPLIMGEGILGLKYGFLPRTVPLLTVIGKPIEVTRNTSPNSDDIEKLHSVFKDALLDLYRKFEHQYNDMVSLVREKGSQTVQKVAAPSMETSSAAQEKEESEKSKEPSASMDESRVEPSEEETTENEPGVEKMKEKSKVLEEKMHEPSHHVPLRFVE